MQVADVVERESQRGFQRTLLPFLNPILNLKILLGLSRMGSCRRPVQRFEEEIEASYSLFSRSVLCALLGPPDWEMNDEYLSVSPSQDVNLKLSAFWGF